MCIRRCTPGRFHSPVDVLQAVHSALPQMTRGGSVWRSALGFDAGRCGAREKQNQNAKPRAERHTHLPHACEPGKLPSVEASPRAMEPPWATKLAAALQNFAQ